MAAGDIVNIIRSRGINCFANSRGDFWQRDYTFTGISDLDYFADRFQYRQVGTGVVDATREGDVPSYLLGTSKRLEVTTAQASVTGSDLYAMTQKVEGYFIRDSYGKNVILGFWVKSNKTGIYSVAFMNHDLTRSFVTEYTIDVADTWEFKTISIGLDPFATSTWFTDNGIGLQVFWNFASGETRDAVLDSWQTVSGGAGVSSANQVNLIDTIGNYIQVAGEHLYQADSPLPVEDVLLDYETDFKFVQRYFQKSYELANPLGNTADVNYIIFTSSNGGVGGTTDTVTYPRMRDSAVFTSYSQTSGAPGTIRNLSNGTDVAVNTSSGETYGRISNTAATSSYHVMAYHWSADAEL